MSDEDPVMGSEQRGRAGQIDREVNPAGGGADGGIETEGEVV